MSNGYRHNGGWGKDGEWHKPSFVDDGCMSQSYSEEQHGWLKHQDEEKDSPAVMLAREIMFLHDENNRLKRELWHKRQLDEIARGAKA